jgi:hypothetical protein
MVMPTKTSASRTDSEISSLSTLLSNVISNQINPTNTPKVTTVRLSAMDWSRK